MSKKAPVATTLLISGGPEPGNWTELIEARYLERLSRWSSEDQTIRGRVKIRPP